MHAIQINSTFFFFFDQVYTSALWFECLAVNLLFPKLDIHNCIALCMFGHCDED